MILILCHPRTRSSLVAKIFHNHGVWFGDVPTKVNQWGYLHFENDAIKNVCREIGRNFYRKGGSIGDPVLVGKLDRQKVANKIEDLSPKDPWGFKVGSEYYHLFEQFNPKIILVKREESGAVDSNAQKSNGTKKEAREIYRRRMRQMKKIEKETDAHWVDTDDILSGDYTTIESAMDYCGLVYDENLTKRAIN